MSAQQSTLVDLGRYFCPNKRCDDYGQRGKGNLHVGFTYGKHKRHMLYCTTCKTRFSETKLSPFFGSKYPPETIRSILQVIGAGAGSRGTARTLGLDRSSVRRVVRKTTEHCSSRLEVLLDELGLPGLDLRELWFFLEKTLPELQRDRRPRKGARARRLAWTKAVKNLSVLVERGR